MWSRGDKAVKMKQGLRLRVNKAAHVLRSRKIFETCLPVTRLHREASHLARQLQKGKKACMSQKKRGLMNSFAWRIVLGEMLSWKEKLELQFAELGRKKIVFGSKDSALQVKTKLEEEFPKLKNRGGFEILRSGFSPGKSLVLLRPPASVGYSVKFLRDESGLGQALAYIRPLQRRKLTCQRGISFRCDCKLRQEL